MKEIAFILVYTKEKSSKIFFKNLVSPAMNNINTDLVPRHFCFTTGKT